MSHTTFDARAVAVTDVPGIDAVADVGPHVEARTSVHIHTGRPTRPVPEGSGAMPMSGPSRRIESSARWANVAGVAVPP
ncbi:MAG: hypothetical protein AB7H92_17480 [Microbacteriaceae bacterium]